MIIILNYLINILLDMYNKIYKKIYYKYIMNILLKKILLKNKYRKINILKKNLNRLFPKKFIGLIVRCKDEPYVSEFVNYYIKQGIDKIYIINDNSNKEIYKDVINNEKVFIIYDNNIIKKNTVKKLYMKIKNNFEWIIYVDMDEYITTKKNINKTIKEELETTFKNCMCIKIPWVMMSCNSIENNPESLLKTNIYRWNHNNTHNNPSKERKFRCRYEKIEVKCIFKPKFFNNIYDHHPLNPTHNVKIVESIKNTKQKLNLFYNNLREKDIEEGYLLCYHYRILSIENCLDKIKNNVWYKKYKLEDLLSTDYPEIIDETLKNKSNL